MSRRPLAAVTVLLVLGLLAEPVTADYKPEFKLSVNTSSQTAWGRGATRFADILRHRTQGRIKITPYFDGQLFAGKQTTEFLLLQEGGIDFAMGSTINWSAQVKELNLFALPFLFPGYQALDAVQAGEPGKRLFRLIEEKGVVAIGWGENGFRELTNSKRPVRRPEDLQGLRVRVVGIPIFVARTWASLTPEDRTVVRKVGEEITALQKREVREGLEGATTVLDILQKLYGMEGIQLTPDDVQSFRDKTRPVYSKWVEQIGADLVRSAERIVESAK